MYLLMSTACTLKNNRLKVPIKMKASFLPPEGASESFVHDPQTATRDQYEVLPKELVCMAEGRALQMI